jgi:CRP-like cAMP-binding protein
MWVILSGKVSVVREHPDLASPVPLAILGPGEVVGEMGLLDGDPRSATVSAIEPTVTMEVPQNALSLTVTQHPDVYGALVKVLSKRLRDTNELVAQTASTGKGVAPSSHKP